MRLADLLTRLLCALVLIGSSWPVSASEAVCVLSSRVVVPMATCGMPCCAKSSGSSVSCPAVKTLENPKCCPVEGEPSVAPAKRSPRFESGCRCELRPKATLGSVVAPTVEKATALALTAAILTEPAAVLSAAWCLMPQPGVLGSDSGPPPEVLRSGPSGRAPPAR